MVDRGSSIFHTKINHIPHLSTSNKETTQIPRVKIYLTNGWGGCLVERSVLWLDPKSLQAIHPNTAHLLVVGKDIYKTKVRLGINFTISH